MTKETIKSRRKEERKKGRKEERKKGREEEGKKGRKFTVFIGISTTPRIEHFTFTCRIYHWT